MATASTVTRTTVVASFLITRAFTYSGSLTGKTFLFVISTLATPARSSPGLSGLAGCLSSGFGDRSLDSGGSLVFEVFAVEVALVGCLNSPQPSRDRAKQR